MQRLWNYTTVGLQSANVDFVIIIACLQTFILLQMTAGKAESCHKLVTNLSVIVLLLYRQISK